MPEFQRQKRRSLTDEQLYEEYHRIDEPKSTAHKSNTPKGMAPKGKAKSEKSVKPDALGKPAKKASPIKEDAPLSNRRSQPEEKRSEADEKFELFPISRKSASRKSSSEQKESSSRRSKRKKRGRMTLYYVLVGIVSVAAVSILSVTVLFNISRFETTGDTVYSSEEIIAASGINKGNNLLRINTGKAEEQIVSQLVYIDSAHISRGFPNRLVISVEPAKPVLSFACGGSYYTISERGRLLEIGKAAADCPVVKGYLAPTGIATGSQLEDDEEGRIAIALQMAQYMREYGLSGNCRIDLTDTLNIRLDYEGRVEMELGANTLMQDKFYHAGLLLDTEITAAEKCTLMLSNPDRVVKRPVYDSSIDDDGYVVTTLPEEEPDDAGDGGSDDPE